MKRYLFRGATALVLGGFIAACSHDDIDYSSIVDGKLKAYQEVFVDAYGKIDPNQNWGFTSVSGQGSASGQEARITRTITVNGDSYDTFNFPTSTELGTAFPAAIPADADEVADLEALYVGKEYTNQYVTGKATDLFAVYANFIKKGHNLKVTSAGEVNIGGNYQNIVNNEIQDYNVYISVNGNVTINRIGAAHYNLYILKGTVTLPASYGEQAGTISVAAGATLNDGRSSIAANQGIKLYNRGVINATNTEGYDIGNRSTVYNENKFYVAGPLSYSPGAGNTSYFINFSDDAELTAPSMTLNSTCHFFTDGKVTIEGETSVTQAEIVWINNGHYTTGSMEFSAHNGTFYNYCQLIVIDNCRFTDGHFNMMTNSYAEFGTGLFNNFHVVMHDNAGFNVKNGTKFGQQGAGIDQGFYAIDNNAEVFVRLAGHTQVPAHKGSAFHTQGANLTLAYEYITFYDNLTYDGTWDGTTFSNPVTEAQLIKRKDENTTWNLHNVTKLITDDNFITTGFTLIDGSCAATWKGKLVPIVIPIDQSETTDDKVTIVTTKEFYETTELVEQGRVFCEDLGQISTNDLDFNDVVFDAYVYKTTPSVHTTIVEDGVTVKDETIDSEPTYKTTIIVLAAGGTLQLSIAGGYEVHNVLGENSTSTIINTAGDNDNAYGNEHATHDPVTIGTDFNYQSIVEIPIRVLYGNGESLELTAEQGWAPHKILVPIGTKWCKERVDIAKAYTNFFDYVESSENFWDGEKVESSLYDHPKDTYKPRSTEAQVVYIRTEGPTTTFRNKGTSTTTGGYNDEEVLSRKVTKF